MLSSGQYGTEERDSYYQEKFEFAKEHHFEGDESSSSMSFDDFLEEDIKEMVWGFINIAIERMHMKFPKNPLEDVPDGLVFLQQPNEIVNCIQYCFLSINQLQSRLETGDLSSHYQRLYNRPDDHDSFDFGIRFISLYRKPSPLSFYLSQVRLLHHESPDSSISRLFGH